MAYNGTSVAAIGWSENIRVYFQDTDGWVRESAWTGGWDGGSSLDRKFQMARGSPLAVTTADNAANIRFVYRNASNILSDYVYRSSATPNWVPGPLSKLNISYSTSLKFGICSWNVPGHTSIRLYYQDSATGDVKELVNDGGDWVLGSTLGQALQGTQIAAVALDNTNIRVYYQGSDNALLEQSFSGKWYPAAGISQAPTLTAIAATAWVENGQKQIAVCWRESDNTIYVANYSGSWKVSSTKANCAQGSRIALTMIEPKATGLRAYYQTQDTKTGIQELCYNPPWTLGTSLPIGTRVFPAITDYADWMQQSLSAIGDVPYNQLCLPGAHDAGMSVANDLTEYCGKDSVLTQTTSIGAQLTVGIRYFDIRPVMGPGDVLFTGHYSNVLSWNDNPTLDTLLEYFGIGNFADTWQGGNGESLADIITQVNEFNQSHRELIVLNLSHMYSVRDPTKNRGSLQGLAPEDWEVLQKQLSNLEHVLTDVMVAEKNKGDIATWTLNDFIADGPSVVVVFDDGKPDWWGPHWPMSTSASSDSGPYYADAGSIGLNRFTDIHTVNSPPYGFTPANSQRLNVVSLDTSQTPFQSVISYLYDSGKLNEVTEIALLVVLGAALPDDVRKAITDPASVNTLNLSAASKKAIAAVLPACIQASNITSWPNKISGDQCDRPDVAQWCVQVNWARWKYASQGNNRK